MIHAGRVLVTLSCLSLFSASDVSTQPLVPDPAQAMQWRMIGPFRGGRNRAVAGVAGKPNIFYTAQVNGGIWKSDDSGRTWTPIFDGQPTQSIGSIAVAPSNPNIIYAGSGEGLHRPDLSVGDGVYRSSDAGNTWTHTGLTDAQQIPAIAVDPRDPNRLFVAALGHPYGPNSERGVFRSTDAGATWKKVLYRDENTGASDIEIDPSNPDVLYAALWDSRLGPTEDNNKFDTTGGGLFKSTDGGETWRPLKKGLPANLVQIDVAIAPSDPRRLYATISTTEPTSYMSGAGLGFFRSDDGGESWIRATTDPRPVMLIGGGDLPVPKVDPQNPDIVYSASIVTSRSTDGGRSWTSLRGAPGGDDYQNVWISPVDSNVIMLASDQGTIISVNGGRTWSSWYNQPTAQLYHVAVTPGFPYRVCGGQQESGSVCIASRGDSGRITSSDWRPVGTIEYGYVAPDPLDADLVYGGGRREVTRFRWSSGQVQNVTPIPLAGEYRANRSEPVIFSPVDPHILYYASNVLFKTTTGGQSWKAISPDLTRPNPGVPSTVGPLSVRNAKSESQRGVIYSVAPGMRDARIIWAGTDDGLLWVTRDGGAHWTNVTPPGLTPWSKVTQIAASAFDDETAYASVSRFRIDDLRPYIYRTRDGGRSWQPIVAGLPDSPVNAVREDPARKGLLYAGTETAVWTSFDDGNHWQPLQRNLPHTSVRDLIVHQGDLIVATHGRGFWILDDLSPLRQFTPAGATASAFLVRPSVALRVRPSLNTDTPLPADEPAGENPPDGAVIDYSLATSAGGPVTLEILDGSGHVARRYSSTDVPWITDAQLQAQTIPIYWVKLPETLQGSAGMHRWVWDLRYETPVSVEHQYPIAAVPYRTPRTPQGPLAMPGTYSVRLTANGKTLTAPLTVKMDPRVTTPPTGIAQMFELQTRLATMLSRSSTAVLKVGSLTRQLDRIGEVGRVKGSTSSFREQLTLLLDGPKKVTPEAGRETAEETAEETARRVAAPAKSTEQSKPPEPKPPVTLSGVQSALASLYEMIDHADATPTAAQVEAVSSTAVQFDDVIKRWDTFESTAIPRLNLELQQYHLGPLRPIAEAPPMEGGEHEE